MFIRYKALNKIILNKDTKFILVYWQVFIAKQGVKIVVLTVYYLQTDS